MNVGYIYILVDDTLPGKVFKVGRTTDPRRRLQQYPGKPRFLDVYKCSDHFKAETELISAMKGKFTLYKGREYFAGDRCVAMDIFGRVCRASPCPMELD